VLPAAGKSPLRSGFNRWTRPPGPAVVARWALKCPEADILYVTGLSRGRPGGPGLVVVDGDDAEACHRIEELFGETPAGCGRAAASTSSSSTPAVSAR
jgi:hypothetical protein